MAITTQRRLDVEDFLFREAELLDSWRLPEWADLYADDAHYEIASMSAPDPVAADPAKSIFIVADDKERLMLRANRLMKKTAHCEFPHSKTRHMISNVRVTENGHGLSTKANFITYRTKSGRTSRYMGEAHYLLEPSGESFRIKHKRCVLDLDTLNDQGRLTILL
ncbi:MAG: aromatic-ring-hydroxylating dioxygenase subunit beta [Steroidobacteraceae bacterium]